MITICTGILKDEIRVAVTGHAGFAEKGQDIVCAAVSMMCAAFAEAAKREDRLLENKEEDGKQLIRVMLVWDTAIWLRMFMAGAELLEAQYPDHVGVIGSGRNQPP